MRAKSIFNLIVQIILLVNVILTMFGINPIPFDEDAVYQVCSAIAVGADALWVWWKNMPVTDIAIHAQEILNISKAHKDDKDEEFFEEESDDKA